MGGGGVEQGTHLSSYWQRSTDGYRPSTAGKIIGWKCWKKHYLEPKISKFSGGAYPQIPLAGSGFALVWLLHGHIALQTTLSTPSGYAPGSTSINLWKATKRFLDRTPLYSISLQSVSPEVMDGRVGPGLPVQQHTGLWNWTRPSSHHVWQKIHFFKHQLYNFLIPWKAFMFSSICFQFIFVGSLSWFSEDPLQKVKLLVTS